MNRQYRTHGSGTFDPARLKSMGSNVIFEPHVQVFHPETIELGKNIYIGHNTILKGYFKSIMRIGDHTWIGQNCYFHSAGGIVIGRNVGIGPGVKILTSYHIEQGIEIPILFSDLAFDEVTIGDDSDVGIGAIILPGVHIGKGVQIGAGAVVTKNIPDYAVAFGNPARIQRHRK